MFQRGEDGGEPNSISILPMLLEETAMPLYRCSTAFQITEQTLHRHFSLDAQQTSCIRSCIGPLDTCGSTLCVDSELGRVSSGHVLSLYSCHSKVVSGYANSYVFFFHLNYRGIKTRLPSSVARRLDLEFITYLNPLCYALLPKPFGVLFRVVTAGTVGLLVCRAKRSSVEELLV